MPQWTRTVSWGEADSVGTDTTATYPGTSAAGPVILVGHLNKWIFYFLVFEINFLFLSAAFCPLAGAQRPVLPVLLQEAGQKGQLGPRLQLLLPEQPRGSAARREEVGGAALPWGILSGET